MDIKTAIIELTKFSRLLLDLGDPIQEKEILAFEEKHALRLCRSTLLNEIHFSKSISNPDER
jgi:hypothetical protein